MPVLVRADPAELDYRDGDEHDTRHAVVVIRDADGGGAVWVADASFPEPRRCGLRALAGARASQGWPQPARHGLLHVDARPGQLTDPRAAVAAALERIVRAMRRSGLAAADALLELWPSLPDGSEVRLAYGGTGGALYRSLQARSLHEAAALLGSAQLGHAALLCDDLADTWRAFAAVTDGEQHPSAATAFVRRIARLEHRHVETLEAYLRTCPSGGRRWAGH